MAGKGRAPKPAQLRQRRNKAATKATLPSADAAAAFQVPELPEREVGPWHPLVLEWWGVVWRSPMAAELLDADQRGGLVVLAGLYHDFFSAASPTARKEAATEIRLQEARFGLDPISRRRLQWEVARGEEAQQKRTITTPKERQGGKRGDPRDFLKVS